VLAKDPAANTLIVGPEEELGTSECTVTGISWISGEPALGRFRAEVKTRYTAREVPAEVTPLETGNKATVRFDAPVRDLTPGQAAVFYVGDIVLGGGAIVV
ncbi:MAG: aminomethyltransferase beta-barrel domain-containing protein, partial [Chloroflexota bacterium]